MPKKILAIDGGGIRGLIPAIFLSKLEETLGKPICEVFDIIAGTSTGGILALGLTVPDREIQQKPQYQAEDLIKLYSDEGKNIFSNSLLHKIISVDGIAEEKYDASGIENVLKKYFGTAKLSESLCPLLIPSYETELREPFFFRSERAKEKKEYDFYMWEAARATSAAPTYFEPFKLNTGSHIDYYSLIDGGVFANNPAMCALAELEGGLCSKEDVLVVSLGTGEHTNSLEFNEISHWGLLSWARPILDVVFDGVSKTVDFQLRQMLKGSYFRFQVNLAQFGADRMDDVSEKNLHELKVAAEKMIEDAENDGQLEDLCKQLSSAC